MTQLFTIHSKVNSSSYVANNVSFKESSFVSMRLVIHVLFCGAWSLKGTAKSLTCLHNNSYRSYK